MNKTMKIGIVVALVVVVGIVLARKAGRSDDTSSTDVTERPTSAEHSSAPLPRLVDLGAGKCIPCKMMEPVLEQLRQEYAGRLRVEFYDVWNDPDVGKKFGIKIIPTQIFFDSQGRELWRHEGFMAKEEILAKWKELGVDLAPGRSGAKRH